MERTQLSALILEQLRDIGKKIDETSLKIAKLEIIYENLSETNIRLEKSFEKEIKIIDDELIALNTRLKELELYKTGFQARMVVIGSIMAFVATAIWTIIGKYIIPLLLA